MRAPDGGNGADNWVEVAGSVTGTMVVGDHNVVVTAERSHVTVVQPGRRPEARRRDDVRLLPRRVRGALGRDAESEAVARALDEDGAVQVYGPSGTGKSTLLRMCAHRAQADRGPVVFVDAAGQEASDVLHEVFAACYDAPGYRPGRTELRRFMADVGATVVLDDLECPREDLDGVLDAVPESAVLLSSTRRTLWSHGSVLPLEGLGHADALALLARSVGHPLDESEQALADELVQATSGRPRQLLLCAEHGRLLAPAELPDLLPRVVESLEADERAVASLLALAGPPGADPDLLSAAAPPGTDATAACEHLERLGIAVPTGQGHRIAPDLGGTAEGVAPPSGAELAAVAERLAHWVTAPGRPAEETARAEGLITRTVDALDRAGSAEAGVRLARAAAPPIACSLNLGAWGRLVERGHAAAERARDNRAVAYFLHEEGVRSLVTGRRAAAAAGFAAAAALWREMGDEAAARDAGEGAELCGPEGTDTGSGADGVGPGPDADADPGVSGAEGAPPTADAGAAPPGGGEAVGEAAHQSGGLATEVAGAADPGGSVTSTVVSTGTGTAGKAGAGITAKLAVGGGLAAVTAGGVVLGQQVLTSDTVPVSVMVATAAAEVAMPGEPGEDCAVGDGATDCTTVVDSAKGETGPIEVDPDAPLPEGVSFLYWGCEEGPGAESCTVRADAALTVCISTTAPQDAANRRACAEATGSAAAFRPVAWNDGGRLKAVTAPGGEVEVLEEEVAPGSVAWSADGTKIAWLELEEVGVPADGWTVHLRDLAGGEDRTWTCEWCTIAFLGDTLVSSGWEDDLLVYPEDGGDPTGRDLPQIPDGPPGDTSPNIELTPMWSGGEQRLYAHVRDDPGDPFHTALYEIVSLEEARHVVDTGSVQFNEEVVVAVSPDGTRGVVATHSYGVSTSPCAKVGPVRVVDFTDGTAQAEVVADPSRSLSAAWFDDEGTAKTVFMPYGADSDYVSEAEFDGYCIYDSSVEPEAYTLDPEADDWSPAQGEGLREVDLGEGWTARYGDGRITLLDDSEKTVADRADVVFPTG
ncbi:AAA family ATPase [Nocardiopsis halophila]|uniref:AAA family ATPase n=1 Tax=Nocardiopsis halophila TaxID=141692 RepID=UPI000349060A|nr:AAA family ATPase [Nocardiopsis halophila]